MLHKSKEVFSEKIHAGKRIYFVDVKETRDGSKYLVLSESQLVGDKWQHSRIMIFEEVIPSYITALRKALKFMGHTSWMKKSYSLTEIRQQYPNAYAKWTGEEESRLRDEFLKGKSVEELAKTFKRKPSAIRARLRRLGLLK